MKATPWSTAWFSGIFPICPSPLFFDICPYNENSWEGPRQNQDLSRNKWETPRLEAPWLTFSKSKILECRKWRFKRWGFKQIWGHLRKEAFFLRFLDFPGALSTLRKCKRDRKRAKKDDFGRFPGRAARYPLSPHLLHPICSSPKTTIRVQIITGSLVILEKLFPQNNRYRYRLEIWFHVITVIVTVLASAVTPSFPLIPNYHLESHLNSFCRITIAGTILKCLN